MDALANKFTIAKLNSLQYPTAGSFPRKPLNGVAEFLPNFWRTTAVRVWPWVLVVLVLGDVVALAWLVLDTADAFKQWETLLGLLGITTQGLVIARVMKKLWQGNFASALELLANRRNQVQVLVPSDRLGLLVLFENDMV